MIGVLLFSTLIDFMFLFYILHLEHEIEILDKKLLYYLYEEVDNYANDKKNNN